MRAEINVTSLVDVAFTLLLIFIITAPILQGGLNLNVPRAASQVVTADQEPFLISVPPEGEYAIGADTRLTWEEMQTNLPALFEASGRGTIFIEADAETPWEPIARLIGLASVEMEVPVSMVVRPKESGD